MTPSIEKETPRKVTTVEEFNDFLSNPGEPTRTIEMRSHKGNEYQANFYNPSIELDVSKVDIEGWGNIRGECFQTVNFGLHKDNWFIATVIDKVRQRAKSSEDRLIGIFSRFDYIEDLEDVLMIIRFGEE
jgi:hypothetical protein